MDTQLTVTQRCRAAVEDFHCDYADTLDRGDIAAWPAYFTEDAIYRVISRDNHDAGRPLCLMFCDGMGMLKDRAYAIEHTEMFAPRYVQHHVSLIRVTAVDCDAVRAEANYLIYETLIDEETKLLQAGRYFDRFAIDGDRLLLRERTCVYHTVLVPNCVVYPV